MEEIKKDAVRYLILQKFSNGYSLTVPGSTEGPKLVEVADDSKRDIIYRHAGEKILAEKLNGARPGNFIQISYKVNRSTISPTKADNEDISNNIEGTSPEEKEARYMEYSGLHNSLMKDFFLSSPIINCYKIEPENKDDKPKLLFIGDSAYFVSEIMKVKLEQMHYPTANSLFPPLPYVEIPATVWNMKRLAAINPKAVPIPKNKIQLVSLINKNKQKLELIKKDIEAINEKENKAIADAAASAAKGKKGK